MVSKRNLFILGNLLMIPIFAFLAAVNYSTGETHDFYLDLALFPFFLLNLYLIFRFQVDRALYRFAIAFLIIMAFYTVFVGSGYGTAPQWLIAAPVALFFFLEKEEGFWWVVVIYLMTALLMEFSDQIGGYEYSPYERLGFYCVYLLVAGSGYLFESSRSEYLALLRDEKDLLSAEAHRLQEAIKKVKTLSGLLPICASCHKIRDDKGYWQKVESYLQDHTEARFSHSICPECSKKYSEQKADPEPGNTLDFPD